MMVADTTGRSLIWGRARTTLQKVLCHRAEWLLQNLNVWRWEHAPVGQVHAHGSWVLRLVVARSLRHADERLLSIDLQEFCGRAPGPASYTPTVTSAFDRPGYSIAGSNTLKSSTADVPGPGAYIDQSVQSMVKAYAEKPAVSFTRSRPSPRQVQGYM